MRILATLLSLLCVSSLTLGQLRPVMSKRSPELEDVRRRLAELKMDSLDLSEIGASTVAVRELSSGDTRELSGIGAMVAAGEPDAFIQSYSSLAALRKSGHVIEIGRFSDSPSISDLATLTIEANDLYALWKATPGDSQIKLSETEIKQIRTVVNGNRFTEPIRQRLSAEYKQVLAKRMSDYINKGSLDSVSYADKEERVNAEQTFETLAREQAATPGICSHLASLWTGSSAPVFHSSSFCYWAKERFGELKPVINLIQVIIHFEGART
ncbi:MAG TPA: hypothetical protein VEZ90_01360, partial [Blastocatellia bacterium]|nr:hypothetical protein [Blastocatellia bacterium]